MLNNMRIIITLILLWVCLSGCTRKPYVNKDYRDTVIVTNTVTVEKLRDTTIYISVEKEVEKIVTRDTVSTLKNKMAGSTAMISEGLLHHSLETYPQEIEKEIQVKEVEVVRDSLVYIDKEVEIIKEVNFMYWWQKGLMYMGIALLGYVVFTIVKRFF